MRRLAVTTWGTVQGVGFRPFVHAAATARGLSGWVRNASGVVHLEVQGPQEAVASFLSALAMPPPAARIDRLQAAEVPIQRATGFRILDSAPGERVRPGLAPDQAICPDCAAEMDDPAARRHLYPFTNCARCGPRYSIVEALPYDRPNTAMKGFSLCPACAREYGDPDDRRFHAQAIACPTCGPGLAFIAPDGTSLAVGAVALDAAAALLLRGGVLALKGLGGFQLLVDATDALAILALRERKRRPDKPFAVMFPSFAAVQGDCLLSAEEEVALRSPEAPIVLVRRREGTGAVAEGVAPGTPWLGVMLPCTPLHKVVLARAGRPLVCTSGNRGDEPMCTDDLEARRRLAGIADGHLVHDRPVVRPLDDSLARIDDGQLQVLRRARGFAPLPSPLASTSGRCILATGAQLKSTLALAQDGEVVVSQHLGDLSCSAGVILHERTARELTRFFQASPTIIACDLHPDYASSRLAERLAAEWRVPLARVQHHHAHVAACLAEHGLTGPVLGLAWDGAGLGPDGTIWGGEALVVDGASFHRVAHVRHFPLPGGEAAIRDPSRSALGLLHELLGPPAIDHLDIPEAARKTLLSMLATGTRCPRTSSVGRLFDAVAALTGVRSRPGYEGQAAVALELAADGETDRTAYPFDLSGGDPLVADWGPLVRELVRDRDRGVAAGVRAARFHNALADLAAAIARQVGLPRVALSGGCFQNLRLLRSARARLQERGFRVYAPRLYPPHDGGLALGQIYVAACQEGAA